MKAYGICFLLSDISLSIIPYRSIHTVTNGKISSLMAEYFTVERAAISFSNAWKWKVKVKLLSRVWLLATPWTTAYQAPLPMGFSRQQYWSGVPLSSPYMYTPGANSLVAQSVKKQNKTKHLPAVQETWVQSLGQEDPLEKEMPTHSSIHAWKIPWTEEPGRLQSMGLQELDTT